MTETLLRIDLESDDGSEAGELEESAVLLREELLELNVDAVERPEEEAPAGARSAGAAVVGTLLVSGGREAVAAAVHTVADWLRRSRARSAKLTLGGDVLELGDVSREEQRRLVDAFLARHEAAGGK